LLVYHPNNQWCDTGITLDAIKGAWHHIRIIRSGTTMSTYLDDSNSPYTATLDANPGSGNGHLNIGADRTGKTDAVFKGSLDELKIYNIAGLGNNDPVTNLMAYWSFDKNGDGKIRIYASPDKTALIALDNTGNQVRWQSAGGAFYRTIKRN
jgi:hypothetical protein